MLPKNPKSKNLDVSVADKKGTTSEYVKDPTFEMQRNINVYAVMHTT